jgi:hypothetical protein
MRWNPSLIEKLRELAATGMLAADIGAALGTTQNSVITVAGRVGIKVVKYTPEQQQTYDDRAKARISLKDARNKAARREALIARRKSLASTAAGIVKTEVACPAQRQVSLSLPEKRKLYAVTASLTKSEQRAFLTQAVLNTPGVSA